MALAYHLETSATRATVPTSYETESVSQSQQSSFNDSMSSQRSEPLGTVNNASSASQPALPRATTPATSLSNHSSQERSSDPGCSKISVVGNLNTSPTKPTDQGSRLSGHVARPTAARQDHTSAPKRMRNGELKSNTSSLETSPTECRANLHSRTSSTASREGQAAELKAKLAYAKFKVEHGYEDLKLAEVERITSQQGSPISAASDINSATMRSPSFQMLSPGSLIQTPRIRPPISQPPQPELLSPQRSQQAVSPQRAPVPVPQSYEDFWNNRSHPRVPVLAPPVNLQARASNEAQTPTNRQPPPPLQTLAAAPTTPRRVPRTGLRSPSEQAASEAEAAEVLTFLSSPNNSGYYPGNGNNVPNGSPLRPSMPQQFGSAANGKARNPASSSTAAPKATARAMSSQDIDRCLDAMSDSEDEGDRIR